MTGKDMLSRLILTLNDYLLIRSEDVMEKVIYDENLLTALSALKALVPAPNFISLIESLENIVNENADNFLNEPYTVTGRVETIDFSLALFDRQNRPFAYSDTDFGFFSSKSLIQAGAIVDISLPAFAMLWKQMQEVLERSYTQGPEQHVITLLECIRTNNINTGFVINKNAVVFDAQKHYSYIYLCYLNNSKSIDLPPDLIYSTPKLNNTLALNPVKIYEQFFDVYDVINELNQAPDIIARYLKLYHILEYFVYRVYLVDLVTRVGTNKFFVREYAVSAEKMKGSEGSTFVMNFQKIFLADRTRIRLDLAPFSTVPIKDFLRDKAIVKGYDHLNLERVAALIYGLRCSIVHNKESEYHLTITNSEDYAIIIPLITQLIKTLEFLVIQKIADNDVTIKYPQRQMNLY